MADVGRPRRLVNAIETVSVTSANGMFVQGARVLRRRWCKCQRLSKRMVTRILCHTSLGPSTEPSSARAMRTRDQAGDRGVA